METDEGQKNKKREEMCQEEELPLQEMINFLLMLELKQNKVLTAEKELKLSVL